MDEEYNMMTDATQNAVTKLLEERGYNKVKIDSWEQPLFRNNQHIGIRVEKADEDNFDMYQAHRRGKKKFIPIPKTCLSSKIEESLMRMDEEFFIETGQIEEMPNRNQVEIQIKTDFEKLRDRLIKDGYKTDFYITREGFDI